MTNKDKLERAMVLIDMAAELVKEVRDDIAHKRVADEQDKQAENGLDVMSRWLFDE